MLAKLFIATVLLAAAPFVFAQFRGEAPPGGPRPVLPARAATRQSSTVAMIQMKTLGWADQDAQAVIPTITQGLANTSVRFDQNQRGGILTAFVTNPDNANTAAEKVCQRIKALVDPQSSLNPQLRQERLVAIDSQETQITQKEKLLRLISEVWNGKASEQIEEQLSRDKQTQERLQQQLDGLRSRQSALEIIIQMQKDQAQERIKLDPVIQQLEELVKIRSDMLARTESAVKSGGASQGEVAEPRAALADAKIRLAERQEADSKSGKGELLDRLSDELTMRSVDVDETYSELQKINDRLLLYQSAITDEKALDELIKNDPRILPPPDDNVSTLLKELNGQIEKLKMQRFALEIMEISLVPLPATEPVNSEGSPQFFHPPGAPPGLLVPMPQG